MNKYVSIFKNWFAYAAITTLLCGIIYIVTQQNYRLTANDPQ
jgi:formate hydrogenlyase subunit 3/multisubunit Na+/H+ antiporter MnhD subunit